MNPIKLIDYTTKEIKIELPVHEIILKYGLMMNTNLLDRENYVAHFIQCVLETVDKSKIKPCLPFSIIFGTSGGIYSKKAAETVLQVCAANDVNNIYTGRYGVLPLPTVSLLIRKKEDISLGFYLGYSDYYGESDNYYNIKCIVKDGRLMNKRFLKKLNDNYLRIQSYKTVPNLTSDFIFRTSFKVDDFNVNLEVINSAYDYLIHSKKIFNYFKIIKLIKGSKHEEPLKILIDCRNGATGPMINDIFTKEFGLNVQHIYNSETKFDEPNKRRNLENYNCWFIKKEIMNKKADLGVVFNADGTNCLIFGSSGLPVSMTDAMAIISTHLHCIPYYQLNPSNSIAYAFTTNLPLKKTKFGMITKKCEAFPDYTFILQELKENSIGLFFDSEWGIVTDNLRVPDGIWFLLAWLSVMEHIKERSVKEILKECRLYCPALCEARLYYDSVSERNVQKLIQPLAILFVSQGSKWVRLVQEWKDEIPYVTIRCKCLAYMDNHLAPRILFEDGSKIGFRILQKSKDKYMIVIHISCLHIDLLCDKSNCNNLAELIRVATKLAKTENSIGLPTYSTFH